MNDWINFRHLYSFWMVARAGGFTRAAEQMRVAQSAVSAQVAALEGYLQEPLFVRGNRTTELTSVGRELLGYADSIFAQSRAINALFRDKDRLQVQRTHRVGVIGGASRNFVYRLLRRQSRQAPDVRLSVSTGSYRELYDSLRRFELDTIISVEPPKKRHLGEVVYEKLGESRVCLVATPRLIRKLKRKRKKPLARPIDVFKFRHPYEVDVIEKHARPQVQCQLALRMDTDDIPLLRFFANGGDGVAILPRMGVLEDLEAGTVEAIDLPGCPEVPIYGISMRGAPVAGDPEAGPP